MHLREILIVAHNPPAPSEITPAALDPFSYFPDVASKIRPFGGVAQQPDLSYGFHTQYVRCAPGYCVFSLKVEGLEATCGVLYLQVHMLSDMRGAQAHVATIERLALPILAAQGGEASIRFEALRGMTYAVFGRISDQTDATASALHIILDRPAGEEDEVETEAAPTALGLEAVRAVDQLISLEAPTFAAPFSQISTLSQTGEPSFSRWCKEIGRVVSPSVELWETCFILQALERYGLISREAEGLGLGDIDSPIAAVLAARGCRLVMGEHGSTEETPEEWLDNRWQTLLGLVHIPANERQRIRIAPAFMPAPQEDLGQVDFLWSRTLACEMGSVADARAMILNSLSRLRPGGLAVHMLRFQASPRSLSDEQAGVRFERDDIQRLTLDIISHRHVATQLKFAQGRGLIDPDLPAGVTGFGLIVRRG